MQQMIENFYINNKENKELHNAIQERLFELGLISETADFFKCWPYTVIKDGKQNQGTIHYIQQLKRVIENFTELTLEDLYTKHCKMFEVQINDSIFYFTKEQVTQIRDDLTTILED